MKSPKPSLLSAGRARVLLSLALVLLGAFGLAREAYAVAANAWHIPDNTIVDGNGGSAPTMRNPRFEFGNTGTVRVYTGVQKYNNSFGTANQTGGTLFYKSASQGSWISAGLSFHANSGNDQYWYADLTLDNLVANDVIQYYFLLTFDSGAENTYLYGGGDQGGSLVTTNNAVAAAAPYTVRNRPAWIFHANNRVISGSSVQFWSKLGYMSDANNPLSSWVTNGALYYTTDGSTPSGSLGSPGGTTQVAAFAFDHPESNNQSAPSVAGTAMWWVASVPNLLQGLAVGGTIQYKVGFWNSANNEEKFADYNAGTTGQVFAFTNGTLGDPVLTVNGVNGNYTTTHVFVDEVAGDSQPITVTFNPGQAATQVEVFTNLNRRDLAQLDADGDGIEDGIKPPDGNNATVGDNNYFTAFTMSGPVLGTYTLTLPAQKTGAYRLTARWKVSGDNSWRWYTNLAAGRRDHAIVVSPVDSRNINLYEVNVLNIESNDTTPDDTSDDFSHRSTFEDLYDAPNAPHQGADNHWNLDYVKNLGCNWLWFQPIHPIGVEGQTYYPGSPYAVKNFFEVNPLMSVGNTRESAMLAFQGFVSAANIAGVHVMLDAPFNHTAPDAEVSSVGQTIFGYSADSEIRNVEARFYSQAGNYGARASSASDIAVAPDRGDFGKWSDVRDIFFGNYSALVDLNPQDNGNYLSEGDFFDYNNPNFDGITQNVWKYFAQYPLYWLDKTGVSAGADLATQTSKGISGLRADFGQGLPPQLWEYIINKTRSRKWNFVFMSESLDGGAVTYRSNRHFDILNENIVFPLASATTSGDYRNIFEARRNAYGQGLVLLNSTSHDEENYVDPFQALVRYAVVNTIDGAPMIFPGQELGISRTFGYEFYETNFGKQIPMFKSFNSMMPAWNDSNFGNDQLYPVYSGIGLARQFSPALRSSNRWFLDGDGYNTKIFAVAKYAQDSASPGVSDVVLAFANLDRDNDQSDNFKLPSALAPKLGIKDSRSYNVRNIAAYLGADGTRRTQWLWNGSAGYTGAQLQNNGFTVFMKKVPTTNADWATAPYEAQYLKVYDVTPPPQLPAAPSTPNPYVTGTTATFTWPAANDPDGGISGYHVLIGTTPGGSDVFNGTVSGTTTTVSGTAFHQTLYATVVAVNNAGIESATASSSSGTLLLDPNGDEDNDGVKNADEVIAGTDPLDPRSVFHVTAVANNGSNSLQVTWASVPGKNYVVQSSTSLTGTFVDVSGTIVASGTTTSFVDQNAVEGAKFYKVRTAP